MQQDSVFRIKTVGPVGFQEMISGIDQVCVLVQSTRALRILEDARNSKVVFSTHELRTIVAYLDNRLPADVVIRHAVLHRDPQSTAYALMAEKMHESPGYTLAVFSTEQSALEWLNQP